MSSSIVSPFPFFTDLTGAPLEGGYLYLGQSNLNPETAPVNVFWDAALTIPAANPVRTVGGYPSRAGTASRLYVSTDTYSITVRNRNSVLVFSRNMQDKDRRSVSVLDFGAVGDNIADDTAAINSAIAYCNSLTIPVVLQFPSGFYKITGALTPITSATVLTGDSFRGTILFPQGNFDVIKFTGSGARQYGGGIDSLLLDCQGMTGGIALTLDWTQDFVGNLYLANPWNGIYVRQSGNTKFQSMTIDKARGTYCFKAYGSNTTRNSQNDNCDVIAFESDSTFTGTYTPGDPIPLTSGVILDGRVHTVSFGNLRCLNMLRGFVCLNSDSLTQKFVPSFIYGTCLETENTYAEGVLLIAANVFQTGLFIGTVVSESGMKLADQTTRVNINGCNIESCHKSGIVIDGSIDVSINDPSIFRNNTYAGHPSGFSAVEILAGDNIAVIGGRCGKPSYDTYTENQEWGIINVAGTNVRATGVDLRGNYSGSSAGNIYFSQCPGSTIIAPSTPSVGASPWTYTAGATPEAISVNGGTVAQISIQGVPLFTQTNQLFILQPNQSAVIIYSSAPTVRSLKLVG